MKLLRMCSACHRDRFILPAAGIVLHCAPSERIVTVDGVEIPQYCLAAAGRDGWVWYTVTRPGPPSADHPAYRSVYCGRTPCPGAQRLIRGVVRVRRRTTGGGDGR